MTKFKPMLAAKITHHELDQLNYPVHVSPKIDGVRCLILDGIAVSRKLKPIPNKHIQDQLKGLPDGLDGELVVIDRNSTTHNYYKDFNECQSAIMTEEGEPDFGFVVFDFVPDVNYRNSDYKFRLDGLKNHVCFNNVNFISTTLAYNKKEVLKWEEIWLEQGYEGLMIRSVDSKYKFGRSTLKQQWLLKLVKTFRCEAVITGFEEEMQNNNKLEKDELGHAKRSSHQDNKVGKGILGAFCVKMYVQTEKGRLLKEFKVGTGMTKKQKQEFWETRNSLLGKYLTIEYRELTKYNVPRFPAFKGIRNELDF